MGINYYTAKDRLHIGKKSAGNRFVFRAHKDIQDTDAWKERLKKEEIVNEYGRSVDYKEFWAFAEATHDGRGKKLIDSFYGHKKCFPFDTGKNVFKDSVGNTFLNAEFC